MTVIKRFGAPSEIPQEDRPRLPRMGMGTFDVGRVTVAQQVFYDKVTPGITEELQRSSLLDKPESGRAETITGTIHRRPMSELDDIVLEVANGPEETRLVSLPFGTFEVAIENPAITIGSLFEFREPAAS